MYLALYTECMALVVILAGGDSDEREVSLRSGAAVAGALEVAGHTIKLIDPKENPETYLPDFVGADVVFPALHGKGGEDGVVQMFLEQHGIPFVGSSSQASELCFDKAKYARLLCKRGIKVPETELVDISGYHKSKITKKPYVLKPNDGGSSIDTLIVRDLESIDSTTIEQAFTRHDVLLLQGLIEGDETTVGVLGDSPLAVIEIIPPQDSEFDYENKYNGKTQELCPPQHVSIDLQEQAQILAKSIHELTGCRDMSRTDIIITPSQELYVLETNTIPGLTEQSLFPKAAAQAGINMPELCDQLVRAALARN